MNKSNDPTVSKPDFSSLLRCVQATIDRQRHEINSVATIDVATGLLRLSEEERTDAVTWLCRSLIEREGGALIEKAIAANVVFALEQSTLDLAMLAIALCGPDEARELFPAN